MTNDAENNDIENQEVSDEQAGQGASTALEPLGEVEELRVELEQAQLDLAEAKDQMVRAVAEAQNARRRAEKDVSNARKYALENFSRELLPVIDSLERALDNADAGSDAAGSVTEGVALTHKNFLDVLERFQMEQLNPLSEPFDPEFHEAISMVENPDVEPNTVLDVVQKGYTLNGRLIRAAMVVVSR